MLPTLIVVGQQQVVFIKYDQKGFVALTPHRQTLSAVVVVCSESERQLLDRTPTLFYISWMSKYCSAGKYIVFHVVVILVVVISVF